MNKEKITRNRLLVSGGFGRVIPAFICTIIYICVNILVAPTIYAAGVPGGNIADPVVQGVDIAKPAVVRILATVTGRLTIDLPTTTGTTSLTFPQDRSAYKVEYFGSGAFISAHGDILTADHIVQPPPDLLYETAAPDIADFINRHSTQFVTPNDVLTALATGVWRSQAQYDKPTMRVYLSTDFVGAINATSLDAMPRDAYADVDSILKTADFQHGDVAIVHVSMNDTPSIKLDDSTSVEPQDQLTIVGFPGHGDLLRESATTLTGAVNPSTGFFTVSLNKAYVSAIKQNNDGTPLIQVGGNVEQGNSGGPALNSGGNIVGIVSFGRADSGVTNDTNFLQASNSAQQLINDIHLNTQPGAFELAWSQAFTEYSSSQSGHWHRAQQKMQELQSNYPNFHAIQPFVDYATAQASKETATSPLSSNNLPLLIGIAFLALAVIFALVLLPAQRKKRRRAALAAQSPSYGAKLSSESEQVYPSGGMARTDLKDEAGQNISTTTGSQPVPPRVMQSPPLVPQTPMPASPYNAARSGPLSTNQPPMNPWVQQAGAPAYGQPVPYGQQPYNTASHPRPVQGPVQGAPYPAYPMQPSYPTQQQPYMPYPLVPATPWPPAQGNTPPQPMSAPYAPQNPAQQGAPMQRGQQTPTYGAPYGPPPQNSGTMPAQPRPAQPARPSQQSSAPMSAQQEQVSAPLIPDATVTSDEPTVRANQRSTSPAEEVVKPRENEDATASPASALSENKTEMRNNLREKDAPTESSE